MRALPLIAALSLAFAGVAVACGGSIPMGALRLPYDPAVWSAEQVAPDHWRATPHDDQEGSTIDATIGDAACSEAAMAARVSERQTGLRTGRTTNRHGLEIVWAEGYTGCRNLTAGPIAACVREGDRTWLFVTASRGCSLTRYGAADPHALLANLRREDRRPVYR